MLLGDSSCGVMRPETAAILMTEVLEAVLEAYGMIDVLEAKLLQERQKKVDV
jgi:hypothetical protein